MDDKAITKDPLLAKIEEMIAYRNLTGKAFCDKMGFASSQTLTNWRIGNNRSYNKYVDRIAKVLDTTVEYLKGETDDPEIPVATNLMPYTERCMRPIVGNVSAGKGCIAEEEIIGYAPVDEKYNCHRYYWLQVKGDSMSPKIDDGDLVLVDTEAEITSGSVLVVVVEGQEGFVKKVEIKPNQISLISINAYYPPLTFEGEDAKRVTVVGKVIESKHFFN